MKKRKKIVPLAGADLVAFLRGRADAAVAMFIEAIGALRENNSAIQSAIADNQSAIGHLENCNKELQQVADKNTNIINNFTRLIEGDTEH